MRYRKRQELAVGEWDNITERCPKMSMRLAPFAVEEIAAWLHLQASRYAAQYEGCRLASENGSDVQAAMEFANAAVRVLLDCIARLKERWSVAKWHDACTLAAESLGTEFVELPPPRIDIPQVALEADDNAHTERGAEADIRDGKP